MSRNVSVYWWNEEPNFGDAMNADLLARLYGINVTWAPIETADLCAAGSLIQWITPKRPAGPKPILVWGSGFIWGSEPGPSPEQATFYAVRGPASRSLAGLEKTTPIGDPGLLSDRAVPRPAGRHQLGLVPHLLHRSNERFKQLAEAGGVFIDVTAEPIEVIEQIASCEFIIASSLHGLIIADSYGIPNQWVRCEPDVFGGVWKFHDYYGTYGLDMKALDVPTAEHVHSVAARATEQYARPGIERIKDDLFFCFPCR